jgi:putative flippase GtrA
MQFRTLKIQEIRYLLAGAWNTAFGYFASIWLYYHFINTLPLWAILTISNIIAITVAFLTYKLFVFKKLGNWILEYLKCYLVYGISAIVTSVITIILVNGAGVRFWLSQSFSIGIVACLSYLAHKKFTFKSYEKN